MVNDKALGLYNLTPIFLLAPSVFHPLGLAPTTYQVLGQVPHYSFEETNA